MAITCIPIYKLTDPAIPSGVSVRTDPAIPSTAPKIKKTFTVAVSGTANATASTGYDAVLDAVATYGAGTLATEIGLDATETIPMVAYIKTLKRENDAATVWQVGNEQFEISAEFQWEVS